MQTTTFVGNLTRDPELREAASGNKRATFSIAVNEGERGSDNEKTHFVNFTAFGTLGENVAKSLAKGQRVVVTGRLDTYVKAVQVDGQDKNLTMTNFIASAVGPDLRWATAEVSKVARVESNEAPAAKATKSDDDEAPAKSKPAARGRSKPAPVEDDDDF